MIWFKMSLEKETLDGSEELTQKVRELLETDEVLYTGSHEINENDIEAEDRFWEEYSEWEYDLLAEGTEEEPIKLSNHEIIVITTVEDEKVVQIDGEDLPVWYIKSA
tara:strand:- start:188 stop:508 length:321 start_codon:yes stop_codon:yes gene_type:complete